jgi:predicted transcriptional regulator
LTSSAVGTTKLNSHELQFALLKHEHERSCFKGFRRGKLDIIAEILLFCEQYKTKTSIMYNTNLNYGQLKTHMDALTTRGLLVKKLNKYMTTEKGYRFLELFAQLNDLLEEFPSENRLGGSTLQRPVHQSCESVQVPQSRLFQAI